LQKVLANQTEQQLHLQIKRQKKAAQAALEKSLDF
jgi:hypothetical protein